MQRSGAAGAPGGHRLRKTRGGQPAMRIAARTLVSLVSLAALVLSGWAWATWNDFTSHITRVSAIDDTPSGGTGKLPDVDGKDQNILIVGNDDRSTATDAELKKLGTTRDGGSLNTDTIMVLHVPADGRKATMIAIPRDSYVAIPGHGMNKINSAYASGYNDGHGNKNTASRLAVQTVQNLTGLKIDHFVQVDLIGFYRISNAIQGVKVNMCAPVKEANSGINLPKGVSTIQGTQALAFVRQRYGFPDGLGDLDRIRRQQYFLSAAFRKISSGGTLLNPFKLQKLLKAVSSSLTMDDNLNPLQLAEQMQNLTAGNLSFSTIPTDGFANEDVGSVVVVHPAQVKARIAALIGKSASANGTAHSTAPATHSPGSAPTSGSKSGPSSGSSTGVTTAQQAASGCIY